MTSLRKTSIKHKLTLLVLLTSSVALALACAAFMAYEVTSFRSKMGDNLASLAQIIGDNSSAALDFGDAKAATETLSALHADHNIRGGCIYTTKGEIFAVYDRPNDSQLFSAPAHPGEGIHFRRNVLEIFQPIVRDGEQIGTVYVASDMSELYTQLKLYVLISIGVFLVSALAALITSARLQRVITGPIFGLVKTAREVTLEKNYSARAVKQSDDELGVLIDSFNEMLRQIQQRDADLQKSRAELEHRVAERTQEAVAALSLINATLESTTDGVISIDTYGMITSYNQKFFDVWQLPPEAKTYKDVNKLRDLFLPKIKDPVAYMAEVKALYADPESEGFGVMELNDGRVFERYSKPQRIGNKSVGRVWCFREITERRRAELELAYERDLLRTLLDNSPDRIYFKDEQSRYIKASASIAQAFGLKTVDELLGTTDFNYFDGPRARTVFDDERKIIRTGQPIIDQMEIETSKDGQKRWVLSSKLPYRDKSKEIIGTIGISKDVTAIKETEIKLEQMHKQLLETSRQAGMAEVATSVLHNVGNVLNSLNVSSILVTDRVKKAKILNFTKTVAMLNEHATDLGAFLTADIKGRQIPGYLNQLAEHFTAEQASVLKELGLLHQNIEHIKDIVAMQQSYAKISGVVEFVNAPDMVEDALRMNTGALQRHGVELIREYEDGPPIEIEKHKVLQILVNLVRNSKYACDESGRADKVIRVRITQQADTVTIAIIDNGVGIPAENMDRIFNHGFTTRRDGHGFGLHSAVLAAIEMGGSLTAQSDGRGQGATFTLELPRAPKELSK